VEQAEEVAAVSSTAAVEDGPFAGGFFAEADVPETLDPAGLFLSVPPVSEPAPGAPEDAARWEDVETFAPEVEGEAAPAAYTAVFAAGQEPAPPESVLPLEDLLVDAVPPAEGFTLPAWSAAGAAAPPVSAVPVEEAAPEGAPSVLVVEDNEDTRALLERILGRAYRVCAVPDALSALDRMNRQRFDALVLDINLGGKQTGVDVLRVARTLPGYGRVFAVALTAYALPGDRERFLAAGFDRYVSKPFTRTALMAALGEGALAA
jgi:CheY-like chemotaxis protein